MNKNCEQCDIIFSKKVNVSLRSWVTTRFCSRKCVYDARKNWTAEQRIKLGNGNRGRKLSLEWRKKIGNSVLGQKRSEEQKKNYGHKGSKHPMWKGGITPINISIRTGVPYKLWRKAVFERDDYTCIWCGQRGGELNADHIKPFSIFPELRLDINNGRTLCVSCHKKTHTYGIKAIKYHLYDEV